MAISTAREDCVASVNPTIMYQPIKCYPCTSSVWRSVVEYVCITYLPLTIFLCVVIVFRISVTSSAMNVPVLCCQLLSSPPFLIFLLQYVQGTRGLYFVKFFSTLYGIWNLDFFRSLIPPICLPLNTMQMMALDYLVAVYPFIILTCFNMLLRAHDRGCRLVARLWQPFLWCTARLRQQWNIRRSIIDAFATFFLLSYIKLLNVSHALLTFTGVHNAAGVRVGSFLFYDAHQHTCIFAGSFFCGFRILYIYWFKILLLLATFGAHAQRGLAYLDQILPVCAL